MGALSPDRKRFAFIRNYNLWVRDIESGKETQLTTGGVQDFGYATDNAGWIRSDRPVLLWSPDSRKIATFRHDSRDTGEMYLVDTRVGHPKLESWKYPLPGDDKIFMIERIINTSCGRRQRPGRDVSDVFYSKISARRVCPERCTCASDRIHRGYGNFRAVLMKRHVNVAVKQAAFTRKHRFWVSNTPIVDFSPCDGETIPAISSEIPEASELARQIQRFKREAARPRTRHRGAL